MISKLHPSFRKSFSKLPASVQIRARDAYRRFITDPTHPGLEFKPLNTTSALWSVRISANYRAVGVRAGETVIWFFIGTHAEYDRLLSQY